MDIEDALLKLLLKTEKQH